jgi:hypothetical protein
MAPPSVELIQQYQDIILAMPTQNPYAGVLVNPRGCEIGQARTDIDEIRDAIVEIHELVKQTGLSGDVYEWQVAVPGLLADLEVADQGLNAFEEHTDRLIANLPTVVGMAQSSAGIENSTTLASGAIAGVGGGSSGLGSIAGALGAASAIAALLGPCLPVQGFIGSLLSKGKALMDGVLSYANTLKENLFQALNEIKNNILGQLGSAFQSLQDIMGSVKNVMAQVMGKINSIKDMITQEISSLVNGFINSARMSLANLLSSIKLDPCLKGLLGGVLGGAAASILG